MEKLFKSLVAAVFGFVVGIVVLLVVLQRILAPQPNWWLLILSSASFCFFVNLAAEWMELMNIRASVALALLSSLVWWGLLTWGPTPWLALGSQTFLGAVAFVPVLAFAQFTGRTIVRWVEYNEARK